MQAREAAAEEPPCWLLRGLIGEGDGGRQTKAALPRHEVATGASDCRAVRRSVTLTPWREGCQPSSDLFDLTRSSGLVEPKLERGR